MFRHAIIGAGVMGANHARVTANVRDVEIVLVVDADEDRARRIAAPVGAEWRAALPESVEGLDTAVVAVPTDAHCEYAVALMDRGVHVLVEKPMAGAMGDADKMAGVAGQNGVTLMVGHVEQFNPAVIELDNWVDEIVHVDAVRVGPYSGRVREGVVFDLMIHDLDIVRRIVRSPLAEAHAMVRCTRSPTEDLACALLRFENGATASLTASRIGQDKVRRLDITQRTNTISADLIQQSVKIHRMAEAEYVPTPDARYRQSGVVEIPFLDHWGEPLHAEVRHFFDCVRTGAPPRVGAAEGCEDVAMALRVLEAALGGG